VLNDDLMTPSDDSSLLFEARDSIDFDTITETNAVDSLNLVNSFDIGTYFSRLNTQHLNPNEISNLINNVFILEPSYKFPSIKGRSIQAEWMKHYSHLHFSPLKEGLFCLACALFGGSWPKGLHVTQQLVSQPLLPTCNIKRNLHRHFPQNVNYISFHVTCLIHSLLKVLAKHSL
jgi:hypothetical protein